MHNESHYKVTFNGQCISDLTTEQVKKNLARLFKSPEQTIEKLFSGKIITIKKGLTKNKALAYQQAMQKAGAISTICPMQVDETVNLAAPSVNDNEKGAHNSAHVLVDEKLPAPPTVNTGDDEYQNLAAPPPAEITNAAGPLGIPPVEKWRLDPSGTRISKPKRKIVRKPPSIEHIELSPPKSDMGQARHPVEAVIPDISNLNLAQSGERLSTPLKKKNITIPDLSHLGMGEIGEDIGQVVRVKETVNPDTSHYELADSSENIPQIKQEKELIDPDISYLSLDE